MAQATETVFMEVRRTKKSFENVFLWTGVAVLGFALWSIWFDITSESSVSGKGLSKDAWMPYSFLMVFGGVFFLIGWLYRRNRITKAALREDLLRHGERVSAEVTKIVEVGSTAVNDHHPFIIHVQCEIDGQTYEFRSENIWGDPRDRMTSRVDVYVDRRDLSRHYVDVRFLEEQDAVPA